MLLRILDTTPSLSGVALAVALGAMFWADSLLAEVPLLSLCSLSDLELGGAAKGVVKENLRKLFPRRWYLEGCMN